MVYITVLDEDLTNKTTRVLAGALPIVGAVMLFPAIIASRHSPEVSFRLLRGIFPVVMMLEPIGLHILLGGFQSSSAIISWAIVAPVLAAQRGRQFAERLFLVVLTALLITGLLEYFDQLPTAVMPHKTQTLPPPLSV